MSPRRPRSLAVSVLAALVVVASASAAAHCPPCHPDPLGTRVLAGNGTLARYVLRGDVVRVTYTDDCRRTFAWRVSGAEQRTAANGNCTGTQPLSSFRTPSATPTAQDGRYAASSLPSATPDKPDRIDVRDALSGRLVHSWPVSARPRTLDVFQGIAVFSAADIEGLYALRLRDGRLAMIGVDARDDTPSIGRAGVVYEDDLHRYEAKRRGWLLKVIPRAAVEAALDSAESPTSTAGPIRAFAVDGPRVALAVRDLSGTCDRIVFWHIPWHFKSQITSGTEATCTPGHPRGGIDAVAIGNSRIEWVTRYGAATTVLAASTIACKEWVVTRLRSAAAGDSLGGVSGDGGILAVGIGRHERELRGAASLVTVGKRWRARTIADGGGIPEAISADGGMIATLRQDGTVDIRRSDGALVRRVLRDAAAAVSLRAGQLVVLTTTGTVDVYSVATGARTASWPAPAGVRPAIDAHFGIAVLTTRNTVYALDLATGRTMAIVHAPALVGAAIEATGIVYVFNRGREGRARFIAMRTIEWAFGYSNSR